MDFTKAQGNLFQKNRSMSGQAGAEGSGEGELGWMNGSVTGEKESKNKIQRETEM